MNTFNESNTIEAMLIEVKRGQTLLYKFYYICLTVACGIW